MVSTCCVRGCHNRQDRETDRRYFSVPQVVQMKGAAMLELTSRRRREWISQLRLKNYTFESKTTRYVCSDHFINGAPAYIREVNNPSWLPTLKLGHEEEGVDKFRWRHLKDGAEPTLFLQKEFARKRSITPATPVRSPHFRPSDFKKCLSGSKRRLVKDAVPTVFPFKKSPKKRKPPAKRLHMSLPEQTGEVAHETPATSGNNKEAQQHGSCGGNMRTRSGEHQECCVKQCSSKGPKRGSGRKTFFPFPREDARCKLWVKSCSRPDLIDKSPLQLRSAGVKVCSDHFEDSQFQYSDRNRQWLISDAVPTIFKKRRRIGVRTPKPKKTHHATEMLYRLQQNGNAGHRLMYPENAEETLKIKVEIDYAEDPAFYWMTSQSVAEVLPHADIEPLDIKTEPKDINCEPLYGGSVPSSMRPEALDIKTEPKDIDCDPLHGGIVPSSMSPELLDIKTEPRDIDSEPLYDNTVQFSTSQEHLNIKTEPEEIGHGLSMSAVCHTSMGPELLVIKPEPNDDKLWGELDSTRSSEKKPPLDERFSPELLTL